MTVTAEPDATPADEQPIEGDANTVSLADLARTVTFADAFEKGVKDRVIDTRGEVLRRLLSMRRDTGIKQIDVLLDPDDPSSKVATISLPDSSEKIAVADGDAYADWVAAHYPKEVEYRVHVKESFAKGHIAGLVKIDGKPVDPKFHEIDDDGATTGGVVDGAAVIPASDPTNFRLTFARESKKDPLGGRRRTLDALTGVPVAEIIGAPSGPVIDGGV